MSLHELIPNLGFVDHATLQGDVNLHNISCQTQSDPALANFLEADNIAFDRLCAAVDDAIAEALFGGVTGPIMLDLDSRFPVHHADTDYPIETFLSQCHQYHAQGQIPHCQEWRKLAWSGRRSAFERLRIRLVNNQACPVYLMYTDRPFIWLESPTFFRNVPLYPNGPIVSVIGESVMWHGRNVIPFPSTVARDVLTSHHRQPTDVAPPAQGRRGRRQRRRNRRRHGVQQDDTHMTEHVIRVE